MSHSLIVRQAAGSDSSKTGISASLIVGICILGAIFFCVILASVIRLCQHVPFHPSYSAETPPEYLFRPYAQDQVEHMREVRWLNHCDMWEVGRLARTELGEQARWERTERPRLNRRTGVGWGFVVGKYGYLKKPSGYQEGMDVEEVEEGRSRTQRDGGIASGQVIQAMSHGPQLRSSALRREQQPRPTYEQLDMDDDLDADTPDHLVTEPFPVRVHESAPPQSPPQSPQTPSMIAQQSPLAGSLWPNYQGAYLSAVLGAFTSQPLHKRGSSGSSATSGGPPSPLSPTTLYPQIATDNSSPSYNLVDHQTPQSGKSVSSALDMSGLFHDMSNYAALDMRRIRPAVADDHASYAQSTMSHDSPATPHTIYESEYDDQKLYTESAGPDPMSQYLLQMPAGYPSTAYQQSLQDVFPDQQFAFAHQQMARIPVSHRPTMMADRLQAAQNDHLRTSSPTSNPREKSPFRQNSPYNMAAPPPRRPRAPAQLQRQRSSISPKELLLEEHDLDDDGQTPLIPQQPQHLYAQHARSHLATVYTPNFGSESPIQIPQQYSFVGSQPGQNESQSVNLTAGTPDFPAHLMSMESTNEEGPELVSSQPQQQTQAPQPQAPQPQAQPAAQPPRRPADTSSHSGTYSCTYRGCSLRFDSPAKLQKHKREGHRQLSPSSTSASPNLALRNSQAGPHRCDRPNPQTGKPCNSVFSRPYDLTRHEDTIHNILKQKVRCHLCTEDRSFSRSDALTRHMRVVHPDIDWVGKQKRKSHK
ncbi:hypothetical protein DV735_g717, partial [Chaetothyriales sp. CBS 134920]